MKRTGLYLVVFVLFFLSSCNQEVDKEKTKISLFSFSRSHCSIGDCPSFALEVDSLMNVKFWGGINTAPSGNQIGKMKQSQWESLSSEIIPIIDNMPNDTNFIGAVQDDIFIDIKIKTKNRSIYIQGYHSLLPHEMQKLDSLILILLKDVNMKNVKDSLEFETRAHYIQPSSENINFIVPQID